MDVIRFHRGAKASLFLGGSKRQSPSYLALPLRISKAISLAIDGMNQSRFSLHLNFTT
jgi:hypothetical protein